MSEATKQLNKAAAPEGGPGGRRGGHMPAAEYCAGLLRYLAGEPLAQVAAETGRSVSSYYRQARNMGLRKRDLGIPTRRKGPVPVTVQTLEGSAMAVACGDLSVPFDRDHPETAVDVMFEQASGFFSANNMKEAAVRLRMIEMVRRVTMGWRGGRPPRATVPEPDSVEEDDVAAAPVALRPAQTPPGGDWSTWLFLGGRGAGKTLAGASWLADQAERLGPGGRLALIGPTLHDVREVMIDGVSGVRALPRWTRATRPRFEASRRRLVFANGCLAYAFSAEKPDGLRGPQFSAAWADEFCAWRCGGARGAAETLALLRMGLRLPLKREEGGPGHPRLVVTTTPRPTRALVRLREEASCVLTHAPTADNAEHLSPGFLDGLNALYGGTRRAAQELEGRIVELDGALFTAAMMARARAGGREGAAAPFERVVVAIDPAATARGDACGLIAAASRRRADGVRCATVLADRSIAGLGPDAWARRAVALAREVGATTIVAEVNQGGDMVRAVLKTAGAKLRVREVRATRGKYVRAEPVAALYEQGRIVHAGMFEALEEELMAFGGEMESSASLDRADALVWAMTDLLIDAPEGGRGPRISWL